MALICVFAFVLYLYIGPAATWVSTYNEAKRKGIPGRSKMSKKELVEALSE